MLRNDKEEGRRISDTLQRFDKEMPFFKIYYLSLEDKDNSFFKHDLVKKHLKKLREG
jgi:hypothetical protein